jgi:hypothetical protein
MLRIQKSYAFALHDNSTASGSVTFSSYPATLSSLDDFYIMPGSNMGMVQTTNGIMNETVYHAVTSEGLMAWHRVRIANTMAHNGCVAGGSVRIVRMEVPVCSVGGVFVCVLALPACSALV